MVATAMIINYCSAFEPLDAHMRVGFDRTDFNSINKLVSDVINDGGFHEFRPLVLGDVVTFRKNLFEFVPLFSQSDCILFLDVYRQIFGGVIARNCVIISLQVFSAFRQIFSNDTKC